jgi:hypothetical protein
MTASSQRGTFSQAELAGDPGDNPRYHSVCGAGWEVVGPASLTVNSGPVWRRLRSRSGQANEMRHLTHS